MMLFAIATTVVITTTFEAFVAGVGTAITAYMICRTGEKVK